MFRKWYCESHVAHSYLSELESDELVSVHILVSLLGAVHPESSHTVCCYTYLALCVDLLCRKYRATQLVIAFLSFQRNKKTLMHKMIVPTLEVGEQRGTGHPQDAPNHHGWG